MRPLRAEDISEGMTIICIADGDIHPTSTYRNKRLHITEVSFRKNEKWASYINLDRDNELDRWSVPCLTGEDDMYDSCVSLDWDKLPGKDKLIFEMSGKLPAKYYDTVGEV